MSCVGVGWIVWKDESLLPKELMCVLHKLCLSGNATAR